MRIVCVRREGVCMHVGVYTYGCACIWGLCICTYASCMYAYGVVCA